MIERATIRKRNKKPSKELRAAYGHTPLSSMEDIPWNCRKLIIRHGDVRRPTGDKGAET